MDRHGRSRRRILKGALALGIGTVGAQILTACGGGEPATSGATSVTQAATPASNAPPTTDATLRVQVAPAEQAIMPAEFAKKFEEQTGIKVTLEETIYSEIETKTQTGYISGTLQDVVYGHHRWLFNNYAKGIYLTLDDFIKSDPLPDSADIYPSVIEGDQRDGKRFSVPIVVHPGGNIAVSYNKTMLKEKGLDEPKPGWTFADWEQLARAAADKDKGIFGLAFDSLESLHYYSNVSRSFGEPSSTDGWVMDREGKKFTYATPLHKEIATWVLALLDDKVMPRKADYIEDAAGNLFSAGLSATHASITGSVADFKAKTAGKFEMDAILLPVGPKGRRGTCYSGNQYMVNSKSQRQKEAYNLLKLFSSKEAGIFQVVKGKAPPNGRKSVWTSPEVNAINKIFGVCDELITAGVEPFPMPANARFTEANNAFLNEIGLIWDGSKKWDEHAPVIQQKVQAILDQARA